MQWLHMFAFNTYVFKSFSIYYLQGFLGRAKGIPALELYRLAQKKNRKLVLCGHSLGGAVSLNIS